MLGAAALYLAGAMAVIVVALAGQRRLLRVLRSATHAEAGLQARAVSLAASIGCRGTITLQQCDRIAAPIAVGVFRRRIVIPSRLLSSLSAAELDAVLLHEIAHHRRGHIASGWVRAAVCAAWWWNPLAWMVGARAAPHTGRSLRRSGHRAGRHGGRSLLRRAGARGLRGLDAGRRRGLRAGAPSARAPGQTSAGGRARPRVGVAGLD